MVYLHSVASCMHAYACCVAVVPTARGPCLKTLLHGGPCPTTTNEVCLLQDAKFSKLPGVLSTRVGYTGGSKPNPTYDSVCSGDGHTEAVKVEFDPHELPYEGLLKVFGACNVASLCKQWLKQPNDCCQTTKPAYPYCHICILKQPCWQSSLSTCVPKRIAPALLYSSRTGVLMLIVLCRLFSKSILLQPRKAQPSTSLLYGITALNSRKQPRL